MIKFWVKFKQEQGRKIREKIRIGVNRFFRDLKTGADA